MINTVYILDLRTGDEYGMPISCYSKDFVKYMISKFESFDYKGGEYRPNRYRVVFTAALFDEEEGNEQQRI